MAEPTSHDSSQPSISRTPAAAAAGRASASPSTVSWSVSATAESPALPASAMRAEGDSDPSDAVECVWRSITDPTLAKPLVANGRPLGAALRALAEGSLNGR